MEDFHEATSILFKVLREKRHYSGRFPRQVTEYNMILYPIEQIPDQGNAQRNKSLRLKRELHWIKTLGTQFPHGMNHKIVRKRDIFITFPFSNNARKAFKITKDIYTKLQKYIPMYSRAN